MSKRTPRTQADVADKGAELKIDTTGVQEFNIDDIDDSAARSDTAVKEAPSVEKPVEDSETIASLKAQLKKAEDDRVTAEQRLEDQRNVSTAAVTTEKQRRVNSDFERVDSDIKRTIGEIEKLEAEAEEALNNGENRKAIQLNRQIATKEYTLQGMEYAKGRLEVEKNKTPEAVDADDGITPAARSWINSHPKFNTNQKFKDALLAEHYSLLADGVKPDSVEYFNRLDTKYDLLEGKKSEVDVTIVENKASREEDTEQNFDGAPPSRGTDGGETSVAAGRWLDASTYRPTAEEIEAAEICGYLDKNGKPDVAAYIKSKYPDKFKQSA